MRRPSASESSEGVLSLDEVSIATATVPDNSLTKETEAELKDLDVHAREDIKDRKQHRQQRKEYADKLLNLARLWLTAIAIIILAQGSLSPWGIFNVSDNVLLGLIGGTTANILGLLLIITRDLFPRRK